MLLVLAIWGSAIHVAAAEALPESPLSPERASATFELADPALGIELVAAEPNVLSPVSIAWDADGRLFVAEMTDYPTGPTGGRIRLLEDVDGDGRYEKATVFADGLPYPNSVLPWMDGVLVTAAPNLWHFRDTDGDGRADERRVLFTGFAEGNQQLRANGLLWGLDNWIYGANGRSDGEIAPVMAGASATSSPPGDRQKISIRRRDFRFRPDTGEFEAVAGFSQFGLAQDDWGNRFASWNTIPVRHVVIEERYLLRNRYFSGADSVFDLLPPGDTGRVFPLTVPPLVFNAESSSHFNALAGLTIYRGDALGEKYRGNAFVGESLRNLVHRRILEPAGVTFSAKRGEDGREFLASRDPWFHPVNFATGPDGALYVVDFYRRFVEHPGWVPEAIRMKPPWREGADHGRIWRIKRRDPAARASGAVGPKSGASASLSAQPRLSRASTADLVEFLQHRNGWMRDTAQRLLIERRDAGAVELLRTQFRSKRTSPVGQLHSLWTLDGLGALDQRIILTAMQDGEAELRVHAARLGERFLPGDSAGQSRSEAREKSDTAARHAENALRREFQTAFLRLLNDADARVRLQVTLTLGGIVLPDRAELLARLAGEGVEDRWQAMALLSSAGEDAWPLLQALARERPQWLSTRDVRPLSFLGDLARSAAGQRETATPFLSWIRSIQHTPGALVLLSGFADGLRARQERLSRTLDEARSISGEREWFASMMERAAQTALNPAEPDPIRLAGIRVLSHGPFNAAMKPLLELLLSNANRELQNAALRALIDLEEPPVATAMFARWNEYGPAVRQQMAGGATRSSIVRDALANALERGTVQAAELDAGTRQNLLRGQDAKVAERFAQLLKSVATVDRSSALRTYEESTRLPGDRARGAALFAKACFACHAIAGEGGRVGPDLSAIASRTKEVLLVDIIDPNRQVAPDFIGHTIRTTSGETLNGLLLAETASSLTLRRAGEPDIVLARNQIEHLRADARSLMPEGLEQGMSVQDVADLLTFLREPDRNLLKDR